MFVGLVCHACAARCVTETGWAFSAAEVLADRFCISAAQAASPSGDYANLSLSPQWILDCDRTDMGCGGGLLDDAWHVFV